MTAERDGAAEGGPGDPAAAASAALAEHLGAEEATLWRGRPEQGLVWRRTDWFLAPFSLAWCAFAALGTGIAALEGQLLFAAIGVLMTALGGYLAIGRFFVDARLRAGTLYAITERRALIATDFPWPAVKERAFGPDVELLFEAGAPASLRFVSLAPGVERAARLDLAWTGAPRGFVFERIAEGAEARRTAERALARLSRARGRG